MKTSWIMVVVVDETFRYAKTWSGKRERKRMVNGEGERKREIGEIEKR